MVWVLVTPAEDLPGQWIAHCLDLDIVTQGASVEHAFKMAAEAIMLCVVDDISNGADPFDRKPAPQEDWATLHRYMRGAVPFDSIPDEALDKVSAVAAAVTLGIRSRPADASVDESLELPPPAWQFATLAAMRGAGAGVH
jgi:predicted RNase H-like HicB family nuclease